MPTPNPNQPPPPPPIVGSKLNPAYYIPLPTPKQRKKQTKKQKAKARAQAKAQKMPVATLAQLDRHTHNRSISERLVYQVADNNPGQTLEWCANKALWDLQRDRM